MTSVLPGLDEGFGEPWRNAESLAQVFSSRDLIKQLQAAELAPEFSDQSLIFEDRVNTALSSRDPVSKWVRYREGYSPELVKYIVNDFPVVDGAAILDPMCGSGSTQVAAQQLGLPSIGLDVNPYAVLVSHVKTHLLNEAELQEVEVWLQQEFSAQPVLGDADTYLQTFFPDESYRRLCGIRQTLMRDWKGKDVGAFLEVALLSVLEACSNRRKDGNGLVTRPSQVEDPLHEFRSQTRTMIKESRMALMKDAPTSKSIVASAIGLDSNPRIDLSAGVGAVVFSPPYPNSFDYFESYKLELLFTGLIPIKEFPRSRKQLIRSYRQSGTSSPLDDLPLLELLVSEVMEGLARKEELSGSRDGRTRLVPNLLRGYFSDMREVLESCFKVMLPKSYLHIVVDQSAYAGVPIPTDLVLSQIGAGLGFRSRRITLCRRAKTSGQQLRLEPRLKSFLRETIVTLQR